MFQIVTIVDNNKVFLVDTEVMKSVAKYLCKFNCESDHDQICCFKKQEEKSNTTIANCMFLLLRLFDF